MYDAAEIHDHEGYAAGAEETDVCPHDRHRISTLTTQYAGEKVRLYPPWGLRRENELTTYDRFAGVLVRKLTPHRWLMRGVMWVSGSWPGFTEPGRMTSDRLSSDERPEADHS